MKSPVYGYTNQLARHQTPKGRCGNDRDHEARPTYLCRHATYEPWQCLRQSGSIEDSGEADERQAWRCKCGHEADVSLDFCERCGCTDPLEYR